MCIRDSLCRRHILIPFGFKNNKIQIAMSDPLNIFAIDDVNISTGIEPEIYISSKSDIQKFIDLNYSTCLLYTSYKLLFTMISTTAKVIRKFKK